MYVLILYHKEFRHNNNKEKAVSKPKVLYLTNKELLAEINRSKITFCYFVDDQYKNYDMIVQSLDEITPEKIREAKEKISTRLYAEERQRQKDAGVKAHKIKVEEIDPEAIPTSEIVWRVVTYEHIPLAEGRVKNPKSTADLHVKLNFIPFKHYIIGDEGQFIEVGRSHWKDGLSNGSFELHGGRITDRLARMFIKLVERYAQKNNWRSYTYNEEMRGQALLQLSHVGLLFDENRSDNPFAYYTRVVTNAFTRILNVEKKNQVIRDDILVMNGASPSMTRQVEDAMSQNQKVMPVIKIDISEGNKGS